ncbi:MAG: Cof-type HAD-IIB family hydrolase [Muribaculaceae bacterium]|nr:Cof-type HAD-IIB family hydrolase [Muribaculaceae bacterium]
MRKDTLYVSDMDGTLLGSDSRISARSAEIISRLSHEGAMITVATARTPATVVPLMADTYTDIPAVVMTGCSWWLREAGEFFEPFFLPENDVADALRICAECNVHPFVYVMSPDNRTLDVYHAARGLNKAEEGFYLERCKLSGKRFHLRTAAPERAGRYSMLLYGMGDAEPIKAAAEVFRKNTECSVCCYPDIFNENIYNLEVFPPGVNKAESVERLKKKLGAERLVVFGDNLNDLSMLAVADVAVAMGNALPLVKEAADVVIEPNYTDAVARFIEQD